MNIQQIQKIQKMINDFDSETEYAESEVSKRLHEQLIYLASVSDENDVWTNEEYEEYLKSDDDVTDHLLKSSLHNDDVREIQDAILNYLK